MLNTLIPPPFSNLNLKMAIVKATMKILFNTINFPRGEQNEKYTHSQKLVWISS